MPGPSSSKKFTVHPPSVRRGFVSTALGAWGRRSTGPPDRGLFFMSHRQRRTAAAGACAAVIVTGLLPLTTAQAHGQEQGRHDGKDKAGHVLLISVDGLHSDWGGS